MACFEMKNKTPACRVQKVFHEIMPSNTYDGNGQCGMTGPHEQYQYCHQLVQRHYWKNCVNGELVSKQIFRQSP